MHIAKIILTFLLTISISLVWSQENIIKKELIERSVKIINSDTLLKSVELENEYFINEGRVTDGGCTLTGFTKNGSILKIVSWVGFSYGNEIFEYYYKNNKLLFVYEEHHSFVFDKELGEFRHDSTEITFRGRYYFINNKLIDYITTGHNRFEDDSVDPERTLLKESELNRGIILKKLKSTR